jgi:MFS transporter, FSR family, fosmidomycin resistance protein
MSHWQRSLNWRHSGRIATVLLDRRVATLMLGHFTLDSYVGVLPVMYPLLIQRFNLNLETVALVTLAYVGTSSASQPMFGAIADKWGTRLTGAALLWTAATFAVLGFATTFPALLAVAAVSGLGSGAFHPLGAVAVRRRLLHSRGNNTAMSLYVTAGTAGVAAGPLVGVLLFGTFGIHGTLPLLLPGLLIGVFVILTMRIRKVPVSPTRAMTTNLHRYRPLIPLAATIVMMASRSLTFDTLQAFTPTWYGQLGFKPWFYGSLTTTLILSCALGTVIMGVLADRAGRRSAILVSLLLSIPAVLLYVVAPGPLGFVWAIGVGTLAASTGPLTLMLAQELMSGRTGLASGLVMGVAVATGAVGAPITGFIADSIGLQPALALQVVVVVLTIPLAFLLPSERYFQTTSPNPARSEQAVV